MLSVQMTASPKWCQTGRPIATSVLFISEEVLSGAKVVKRTLTLNVVV